jgi:inorganic pyrophosphatase
MSLNLLHDISTGDNVPNEINVIVEIPKGSHNKYEINKENNLLELDRANYSDAAYPFEYGFVPQTLWEDGDALDVLVLATYPIPPLTLVAVRPVGVMEMTDEGESDHKILVVPVKDKRWDDVQDLKDVNKHTLKEIQHFFETYKELKGGSVVVPGFKGKEEAYAAIKKSIELYKKEFNK